MTEPVKPVWGRAYRCRLAGVEGIGYRGPFHDEVTIFYDVPAGVERDHPNHAHVRIGNPELEVGEPVHVADEAKPGWALEPAPR